MMPPTTSDTGDMQRLSELTRRYARFSVTAGGLGSVLGGVLVLITYFVGALVPELSTAARLALASAPFLWIAVKELLRSRYYQRLGRVVETRSRSDRRWHLGFTLFSLVVSLTIIGFVLQSYEPSNLRTFETLGYLACVAAMPLLVWFFMRTTMEFVVGVFLVAQAAMMLGGGSYQLGQQLQAPVVALALIAVGVRQHFEFLDLSRRLDRLRRDNE